MSTPSQRSKLAWQHSAMRELDRMGARGHPFYQRMKAATACDALARAMAAGELKAIRATLRSASAQVGVEDSSVKRARAVLAEAERGVRVCRECLQQEGLCSLTSAMPRAASALTHLRQLELGARLWEDPWLKCAQERVAEWEEHGQRLQELLVNLQMGPKAFCIAWAKLALGESDVKCSFGPAVTRELLQLPGSVAEFAQALAEEEFLPAVPDEVYGMKAERIVRVRNMLGRMESELVDTLLLREAPGCQSGLAVAAQLADSWVFCCLHQALTGEVLAIEQALEQRLERESHEVFALCRQRRVAGRLGHVLQVDPRHLCLWRLPGGGLKVRLFPGAGQPSAELAQEVLGVGAAAEPQRRGKPYAREFARWRQAGHAARDFFDVLAEAPAALAADREAAAAAAEALAVREAAASAARRAAARAVVGGIRARIAKKLSAPALQQLTAARLELLHATMSASEDSEEVEAAAQAKFDRAEARHVAAKMEVEAAATEVAESAAGYVSATNVALEAAAKEEANQAAATAAAERAARAVASYEALMHGPLLPVAAPTPSARK